MKVDAADRRRHVMTLTPKEPEVACARRSHGVCASMRCALLWIVDESVSGLKTTPFEEADSCQLHTCKISNLHDAKREGFGQAE